MSLEKTDGIILRQFYESSLRCMPTTFASNKYNNVNNMTTPSNLVHVFDLSSMKSTKCIVCNARHGKQPFVSDFSCLLRHAIEKGRGPILYSKKKPGTPLGVQHSGQTCNTVQSDHALVCVIYLVPAWTITVHRLFFFI